MDVLILAPNPTDIARLPDEVQTVLNTFTGAGDKAFLMTGDDATRDGLQRSITTGLIVDLIWYAGYVSQQGIALNDGVVDPAQFAQWVNMTQADQLVLNGCFDAGQIQTIQRFADVEIAAGAQEATPVGRDNAAQAAYLARAYVAASGDLKAATERATAAGASGYRYYPAARRLTIMPQHNPADDNHQAELTQQVDSLVRALRGEWGRPGLIESVEALRAELATYQRSDQAWKQTIEAKISALERIRPITMTPGSALWTLSLIAVFAAMLALAIFAAAGGP